MSSPPGAASITPFDASQTGSEPRDHRGLDDEALEVERNLNSVVEETFEDTLPTPYDEPCISDDDILLYLVKTKLYSTQSECWVDLIEKPRGEIALSTAICKIIAEIISLLMQSTKLGKDDARTVVETRGKQLRHCGGRINYSSPTLAIIATGSSFEGADNAHGYTDVATCLEMDLESAMRSLEDQIIHLGVFAKQMLIQQANREFVRCLYMTEKSVRLVHFDRAGAQFGPLVNIHQEPEVFVRYILAHRLGRDENGKKTPGYITVTGEDNDRARYPMREVDPWVAHPDIESRGLKVWRVSHPATGQNLIIKDSWVEGNRTPEWQHLLRARGIPGVVQMISMEAKRFPFTGAMRAKPSMSPYDNPSQYHKSKCRVVLEQCGDQVIKCKDEHKFLAAMRDIIAGMQGLNNVGLLHRDVSWGNLLLGRDDAYAGNRGVLIDLDLAIDAKEVSASDDEGNNNICCGTPGYMSINVLECNNNEEFRRRYIRDHLDDLESIFYVFCEVVYDWQSLQCPAYIRAICFTSNDHAAAAGAKRRLFEMKTLNTNDVFAAFGPEARKVLQSFFKFMRDLIKAKDKIHNIQTEKDQLAARLRLMSKRDKHYAELLAFFDKALKKLDARAMSSNKESEPSTSATTARKPLFPLKINLPDFLS